MKKNKEVIAWAVTAIIFIITLPVTIVVFGVADQETFTGDPTPKYLLRWLNILYFPFKILGVK